MLTRSAAIAVQTTILILAAAPWCGAAAAPAEARDAAACLAHPTVTCSVDLALAASAGAGEDEDYDRYELVMMAVEPVKDIEARKAFLDRVSGRYFAEGSLGRRLVGDERRVADIAAAIVAGDNATADRVLNDGKPKFQFWWKRLKEVINTLAAGGKPDLAVATEAKYRRTVDVNLSDALGRDLGKEVWSTQQLLARALVDCTCGPDPLPMVLALPRQDDRRELAAVLYARRHDLKGLTSFLTREFGRLAAVKDERERKWIGYAFGLMLQTIPLRDVPAVVRAAPGWLTARNFDAPSVHSTAIGSNSYSPALGRAINAGNRPAVAAIVKLWPHGEIDWLSEGKIENFEAAMKVADLVPKGNRALLRRLAVAYMIAHGDARKGVKEYLKGPNGPTYRKRDVDEDDVIGFEDDVVTPLLARGDLDLAEDFVKGLRDPDAREQLQVDIDGAKKERAGAPTTYAAALATQWRYYQQSKKDAKAGESFLYGVRDLLMAHPHALPFT